MEKTKWMVCKRHGFVEYVLRSSGRYRCPKCTSYEVTEKRRKNKVALVEYKGGKCEICGYDKCIGALEFHHINPSEKKFGLSNGNVKSLEELKKEADKCILVCNRCHSEIHYNLMLEEEKLKQEEIQKNIEQFQENCIKYGVDNKDNYIKMKSLSIDEVQEDLAKDMKYKDIANKYDVGISTLKNFIYKNNIERKLVRKMKNYTINDFVENAKRHKCVKTKMAKYFGVNTRTLEEWCFRNNLPYHKKDIETYINNLPYNKEVQTTE